jgi:hypothetical protein
MVLGGGAGGGDSRGARMTLHTLLHRTLTDELDALAKLPLDKRPADYPARRRTLWQQIAVIGVVLDPPKERL